MILVKLFRSHYTGSTVLTYCQILPKEQTAVKFESQYKTLLIKYILKYCLSNVSHFIKALMCYPLRVSMEDSIFGGICPETLPDPQSFCVCSYDVDDLEFNINCGPQYDMSLHCRVSPDDGKMDCVTHWCPLTYTMQCRYNAVSFLTNTHKRHPVARPLGRGMGCLLCIQHLIDILTQFL